MGRARLSLTIDKGITVFFIGFFGIFQLYDCRWIVFGLSGWPRPVVLELIGNFPILWAGIPALLITRFCPSSLHVMLLVKAVSTVPVVSHTIFDVCGEFPENELMLTTVGWPPEMRPRSEQVVAEIRTF
jgi:hypothetical protein